MKGFRGTWILFAVVAVLAAYTAWEFKKAGPETNDVSQQKKLFDFKNEQVDQIKLTHGGDTVLVIREGETWHMKQPVDDDVEKSAVEAFLYSVVIQKGKVFRSEDESKNTKWADFGLEPAGYVLELTVDKKPQILQISSKNAFDGSYYIRQGEEVMLGDHGLAQIVGRDPSALRSRHLWRQKDAKAERIEVQFGSEKYVLKKEGEILAFDPKPAFKIDTAKVDQWLGAIYNLMPTEIVGDALTDEQRKLDLLVKPSFTMKVDYKNPTGTWILTVGQDRADDVFLYTSARPTVYKTSSAALKTLRVGEVYFRDGKSPFHFDVEQVHDVLISQGKIQHNLVKEGSEWKAEAPDLKVDGEKLGTFFQNIRNLEGQEFTKSAKGLKPDQRIRLRDSQGQTLLDLTWGDEFKATQSWNKGMTFRYVQTNLEKDAMGVVATKISGLIDPKLVSKKAESTSQDGHK